MSAVPYRLNRLGIVMSPDPSDPNEVEGVLNPASAQSRDGQVYLFPRVVAAGNSSKIMRAKVRFEDGVPVGVEREGIAMAPEQTWEIGKSNAGVEDPRITYLPALDKWIMAYIVFGPVGPKAAIAVSDDLLTWTRLGPLQFEYEPEWATDFTMYPNKDVAFFPTPVTAPDGTPSYALIHRPMWDLGFVKAGEGEHLPAGIDDPRSGIWISYVPVADVEKDIRALTRPAQHKLVAMAKYDWESLKIGGGTPPIRIPEGWLIIHHGVSGFISDDPFTPQKNVCYAAGAMILDADDPSRVIARTTEALLAPETEDELIGIVGNVVFPTTFEVVGGRTFVFYGMADAAIGVAELERIE